VNSILFVLLVVTVSYQDYTSINFANATDAVLCSTDQTSHPVTNFTVEERLVWLLASLVNHTITNTHQQNLASAIYSFQQ